MKFKEGDTVKIVKNCDDQVFKGDIGVVVMSFKNPQEAYEVEFLNKEGYLIAQCTLLPDELVLV